MRHPLTPQSSARTDLPARRYRNGRGREATAGQRAGRRQQLRAQLECRNHLEPIAGELFDNALQYGVVLVVAAIPEVPEAKASPVGQEAEQFPGMVHPVRLVKL